MALGSIFGWIRLIPDHHRVMIYEKNAGQLGFIGSGPDSARKRGPAKARGSKNRVQIQARLGLVRPMSNHIYEGAFQVGFKGSG